MDIAYKEKPFSNINITKTILPIKSATNNSRGNSR